MIDYKDYLNNACEKLAEEFFTPPLSKYTLESAREALRKALRQLCKSEDLANMSIKKIVEQLKSESA